MQIYNRSVHCPDIRAKMNMHDMYSYNCDSIGNMESLQVSCVTCNVISLLLHSHRDQLSHLIELGSIRTYCLPKSSRADYVSPNVFQLDSNPLACLPGINWFVHNVRPVVPSSLVVGPHQ